MYVVEPRFVSVLNNATDTVDPHHVTAHTSLGELLGFPSDVQQVVLKTLNDKSFKEAHVFHLRRTDTWAVITQIGGTRLLAYPFKEPCDLLDNDIVFDAMAHADRMTFWHMVRETTGHYPLVPLVMAGIFIYPLYISIPAGQHWSLWAAKAVCVIGALSFLFVAVKMWVDTVTQKRRLYAAIDHVKARLNAHRERAAATTT